MKARKTIALFVAVIVVLAFGVATAGPKFVGVKKCKTCHKKKTGDQYAKWTKMKHSKAYQVLGTAAAKELGKKSGVTDPQNDKKCTKCHITGHNVEGAQYGKKFAKEDGVGCESCHGAGENYAKAKVMSSKKFKADRVKSHEANLAAGLKMPTEQTCKKCHNSESPSFKEFIFAERWEKIKHCNPDKGENHAKTGNLCP